MNTYEFAIIIVGKGDNEDEAWEEALDATGMYNARELEYTRAEIIETDDSPKIVELDDSELADRQISTEEHIAAMIFDEIGECSELEAADLGRRIVKYMTELLTVGEFANLKDFLSG